MALTYAPTTVHQYQTYGDLYAKAVDAVVAREDMSPLSGEQFFRKVRATNTTYKESSVGVSLDIPTKNEDGDPMKWAQVAPGFPKELTGIMFRSGVRIQRKLVELDRHDVATQMISGLGMSVDRKYEYSYWDIFNNGFATHTTGDGLYIFSASHLPEDPSQAVWDNLEASSALSFTSFDTARLNMNKRVSDKGFPMPVILKKLIIPPDLERKAKELQVAEKNPENALNQPNIWRNTWDIVVSPWLTSTTAHFFWGDVDGNSQQNGFVCAERVAPMTEKWTESDPDIIMSKIVRFEFVCGAVHAKHVHGTAGA